MRMIGSLVSRAYASDLPNSQGCTLSHIQIGIYRASIARGALYGFQLFRVKKNMPFVFNPAGFRKLY